jgi:tungstate transport system substrate-binding protein
MLAMTKRRPLLLACLGAPLMLGSRAQAQQRKSLADPLRLGADHALLGLARALQRAFGRDTGIAVQLVPGAALPLLEALERGELDAALTNAPDAEAALDKQGLAHDRRAVAIGGLVFVGPAPKGKVRDPASVAGSNGIAEALQRIAAPPPAGAEAALFLSAGDSSGTHAAELALWRAAKVAPAAPWYASVDKGASLIAQARARGAYALVDRAGWSTQGGAPLAVLIDADPLLDLPVHVMRSFRVNHPAGKMFVAWIGGPKGARVVAGQRGYRLPKAVSR